jgi:parallel beta-helix repeat protein/predicted outer membrane repeat protein
MACAIARPAVAVTRHVDLSATGANNGTSWANAYTSLQSALAAAVAGDEIWVAQGTYRPAAPNGPRTATFQLRNGAAMYGGFPTGGGTFEQRDPDAFSTVLSGDLNSNDGPNFTNYAENVYHVVSAINLTAMTVLDGFDITGGNGNGDSGNNETRGAGLYANDNNPGFLRIAQCRIMANTCTIQGAGAYIRVVPHLFEDCAFIGNQSGDNGGAVFVTSIVPAFARCAFIGNVSMGNGGAIAVFSPPNANATISDCEFTGNQARFGGGAIRYSLSTLSPPRLTIRGCTFTGNQCTILASFGQGGAVYLEGPIIAMVNCQFLDNISNRDGGAAYLDPEENIILVNCDFRGNEVVSSGSGGAVFLQGGRGDRIEGCTFIGNRAAGTFGSGGGVYMGSTASIPRRVINSTFVGNTSPAACAGLYIEGQNHVYRNSIFWGNTDNSGSSQGAQINPGSNPSIQRCCVQNWNGTLGGIGNHGLDPLFVDANGADNVYGTADDDVRLTSGSPAVDAGDNAAVPIDDLDADNDANATEVLPIDVAGLPRMQDDTATPDTGAGTPPIVDMGAHEFGAPSTTTTYIGPKGGNWFTAANWSGGSVPDDRSIVFVPGHVQLAQSAAVAAEITIESGGRVTLLSDGSLAAESILVESSGTLALADSTVALDTESISVLGGGAVQWIGGTIIINGGGWTQSAGLTIGCADAATLDIRGGAPINVPSIQVCQLGMLAGRGQISGSVINDGVVAPGDPTGELHILGAYSQTERASLLIELGGYTRGLDYDTLAVDGQVSLDGLLDVTLRSAFDHVVGGTHTLLTSGTQMQTTFETVNLPTLPDTAEFTYQQPPFATVISLHTMITQTGARLYVNAEGPGGGNGQTWASSLRSLQSALDVVTAFPGVVDEIWVAEGTYLPDRSPNVDYLQATYNLPLGVAIYGGFTGIETSVGQRDWVANETILTGDRFGDDLPNFVNRDDNLLTVVTIVGVQHDNSTTLDGFTVRGGNAGGIAELSIGAGLKIIVARPAIRNCRFVDNDAQSSGGGVHTTGGSLFQNCAFIGNRTGGTGGGLHAVSVAAIEVIDCDFDSNIASSNSGGGLFIGSAETSTVTGCTFTNNFAHGGLQGGGGMWAANIDINGCTFTGNQARELGGGLFVNNDPDVETDLNDCDFTGNIAGVGGPAGVGGAMVVWRGRVRLDNCSIDQNSAGIGSAAYIWTAGTLLGESAFVSGEVFNAGTVSPGDFGQPGALSIGGAYRQVNIGDLSDDIITGTLLIDLGGANPGTQHDVLDVSGGSVVLEGGVLQVDLIDSFMPTIGQEFTIVAAPKVTGRFDVVTMPALSQGLFANLARDAKGMKVSVEELTSLIALSLDSVVPLGGAPLDAELADMDNDGDMDVVLLLDGEAPVQDSVVILENAGVDGGGQWLGFEANPHTQSIAGTLRSMALGKINGDAFTDVLVANSSANAVNKLFNTADGNCSLVPAPSVSVAGGPYTISASRTIGQAVDFVVGSESDRLVRHMHNNGTGTFTLGSSFSHAREPDVVALQDLDADADADLIVVRRDFETAHIRSTVEVRLYNSATQTFGTVNGIEVGYGTSSCEIVDLNGDAAVDIVTSDTSSGRLAVLINSGGGTGAFEQPVFMPVGVQPTSLIARDVDEDGDADLALLVAPTTGADLRLRILRNDLAAGQLILAPAIDVAAGDDPLLIIAGDVDLQAGLDLLAINGPATPLAGGGAGGSLNVFLAETTADPCPADVNNSGTVDSDDLVAVILSWGPCPAPCPTDIVPPGGNGSVDSDDLVAVILAWGRCP